MGVAVTCNPSCPWSGPFGLRQGLCTGAGKLGVLLLSLLWPLYRRRLPSALFLAHPSSSRVCAFPSGVLTGALTDVLTDMLTGAHGCICSAPRPSRLPHTGCVRQRFRQLGVTFDSFLTEKHSILAEFSHFSLIDSVFCFFSWLSGTCVPFPASRREIMFMSVLSSGH